MIIFSIKCDSNYRIFHSIFKSIKFNVIIIICKKCKICIKNYEIIVDLKDTETAKKIWESLPITSKINVWGEEVYFYVSVSADLANDAKDVINLGEIVYWSAGKAIAIGFGKTPIIKETKLDWQTNVMYGVKQILI